MKQILFLLLPMLLLFAGCAEQADPSNTILQYLEARVSANATGLQELTCAELESQIPAQIASFQSIEASLEDTSCRADGEQDGKTVITCSGKIVYDYDGERNERELGSYLAVQENGDWKMCGETQ
jgi:outer membrane lipoprotein-sorting protein